MPVITLEAGKLTLEKKELLIKELTQTASKIMGTPESSFYVFLKENELDNIGVGGKSLSQIRGK